MPWTDSFRAGKDIWPHWSTTLSLAWRNSLLWTATWIHPKLYWMHVLGLRPQNKKTRQL